MPATDIISFHGAPDGNGHPATSNVINGDEIRFKRADNDTLDTLSAVPLGKSVANWSWRKTIKLRFTDRPERHIQNLRFYADAPITDGTDEKEWHGVSLYAGNTGSYTQASVADEAGLVSAGMIDVDLGGSSLLPIDVNNPLAVASATTVITPETWTGSTANFGVGLYGLQYFVQLQIKIAPDATIGVKAFRDLWYRWDEV